MAQARKVAERSHLSDEEIISLSAMAVESFGKCSFPQYPENMFDYKYEDNPEQWNRGYRAWIAEVQELEGPIFTLEGNDGLALCLPPGVEFTGTSGGHFREEADAHSRHLSKKEIAQKAEYLRALDAATVKEVKRKCLYMLELVVAHGKQGEGLGRVLLEAVFAKAEALGCDVYSECDNEPNRALYEHMGFQVIKSSRLPNYHGNDITTHALFRKSKCRT